MTKTRNEYIYQFTGTVLGRQFLKASPTSKYAGAEYLILKVVLENQPFKSLQVFKEKLINPALWDFIKNTKPQEHAKRKYLFSCRNQRGYYYLVDWEELPVEENPEAKEENQ